jgi:formyl-CoA transferase
MMKLFDRERTGAGGWVHTSLLESQVFMLDFQAARWLVSKEIPQQAGNDHPTVVPTGVFATSDGYVNIAASASAQWQRLCEVMNRPEWLTHPGWETQRGRAADRFNVHAAIAAQVREQKTAYWVDKLEGAGLPCGPVYSVDQVFSDPQVLHLGIAAPIEHPRWGRTHLVGSPLNVAGVPKTLRSSAPLTGVHTQEVLRSLGYDDGHIDNLRARGVI